MPNIVSSINISIFILIQQKAIKKGHVPPDTRWHIDLGIEHASMWEDFLCKIPAKAGTFDNKNLTEKYV